MNRITRFVLVVCIVLPFISSCAVNSGSIATAIPVTSTARAFTSGPVNTPTHTLTSEATLTPTPLSESLPLIKTQCVNDASSSSSLDLQGVIVLKHPEAKIDFRAADETGQLPDIDVGFFLLSPNRKKIIKSIDDGFMEQVSPGGKYLAYIHADASWNKKFLGIMDGNGKVINDFALFFDGSWQDYYNSFGSVILNRE